MKKLLWGLDEIEVRPLGPPSGIIHYIDFRYDNFNSIDEKVVKVVKVVNQIFSEIDPFGEEDWDD